MTDWTVDYGNGPTPIQVPHAWRQGVSVAWEGPAFYRTTLDSVSPGQHLHFEGVSYEAIVRANGVEIGRHRGIWDAFSVPLPSGEQVIVEVEVRKNGGPTFPVKDVASGFLPFVYHTFGGIYKAVSIVDKALESGVPIADFGRVKAEGTKLFGPALAAKKSAADQAAEWLLKRKGEGSDAEPSANPDSKPLYFRGILTWGWYPEIGHCNPPDDVIRREIEITKNLGFNLIKFCLWVPSHRYLELMHEAGLWAWIELPLWDPNADPDLQEAMAIEMERIVEQFAHHPNVALWTCGCELHESTSARYRQRLYEATKDRTQGALVKDNSGSAEMYGGDLREYGDFYDFHPYCDLQFYPEVLDSLCVGPRPRQPVLLGEFNDIDAHRDLARLAAEAPYWLSQDPTLNAQGVRWQHDLPDVLPTSRFALNSNEHRHEALMASSLSKARFIRKNVQEAVRARGDIAGYVITGWRDTPISSAGMIDDWAEPRYTHEDLAAWNGPTSLFIIPTRRPPWVHGGNRPGWIDPYNHFEGRVFWRIGVHSEADMTGSLEWDILHVTWDDGKRPRGRVAHGLAETASVSACDPLEVGQIAWDAEYAGGYLLRVRFGGVENSWPIWVVPRQTEEDLAGWTIDDPCELLTGLEGSVGPLATTRFGRASGDTFGFLTNEGTLAMPFWRESAYEFLHPQFWDHMGYRERWERMLPLTPDRALNMEAVELAYPGRCWSTLLNRIDVRTYAEHPVVVRGESTDGTVILTTLRPFGGLGTAPRGVTKNPSGLEWMRRLRSWL